MLINWSLSAWDDYLSFLNEDKKTLKKINNLIKDTIRHPYDGLGKPEALKGNLSGLYSRRIDNKNRLVYLIDEGNLVIIACKGHYD